MSAPRAGSDALAVRYGRSRRAGGWPVRLGVALVALSLLAWVIWAALAGSSPEVRSQVLTFEVQDERLVRTSVEILADPSAKIVCTLRAQDRSHGITGVARVVSAQGDGNRRVVTTMIETQERAVSVSVVGCQVEPD